jgi:hypothetical protein
MNKETLKHIGKGVELTVGLLAIYKLSLLALNTPQRESIRDERDGGKCQGHAAGIKHRCGGGVQVHHILSGKYLGALDIDADLNPFNLITICQNLHDTIHQGKISEAQQNYRNGDKDAYKKMGRDMDEKIKNKQLNWNPEWDRKLQARSQKLTQEWMKRGGNYPLKREQQAKYGRKFF